MVVKVKEEEYFQWLETLLSPLLFVVLSLERAAVGSEVPGVMSLSFHARDRSVQGESSLFIPDVREG